MNSSFLIAQISDLHLKAGQRLTYGVVDTLAALRHAVDHLNASLPRPDIVVISGDLVDFGRPDEYAVLAPELARLQMPCYLVPGNHDHREHLLTGLPEHRYLPRVTDGPLDWVVDEYPLRLIGLDSTTPGAHGGCVTDTQLEWLDEGGSISCVCPGTSHQIVLDLQDAAPAHFNLEPAGYLLHTWHPQRGLVTHNGVFGAYAGPYPFYDDNGLID